MIRVEAFTGVHLTLRVTEGEFWHVEERDVTLVGRRSSGKARYRRQ